MKNPAPGFVLLTALVAGYADQGPVAPNQAPLEEPKAVVAEAPDLTPAEARALLNS